MPINVDEDYDGLMRRVTKDSSASRIVFQTVLQSVFQEDDPSPGIRISLPTLRLQLRQLPTNLGYFLNNASLGIIPYGAGVVADFPATLGIPVTTDFTATLGIPTPTIADPQAALAAHLGQGVLFVQWTHPTPELVSLYELYGSTNSGGPFTKLQHGESLITRAMLHNIPMAFHVYLQVRAVGINGAISNFTPVRQGKFGAPSVRCSVRAISGSTIKKNALFVALDKDTGRLIGLRAAADITISC